MLLHGTDWPRVPSGGRLGKDGSGDGGDSRDGDFTSQCTVPQNLRGSVEVTNRVGSDNHDAALGVATGSVLVRGRGERVGKQKFSQLALTVGNNIRLQ